MSSPANRIWLASRSATELSLRRLRRTPARAPSPAATLSTGVAKSAVARRGSSGLLILKPLEQLARRPPRLGFEPLAQLRRHRHERIRTPTPALGLLLRPVVGRTSPSRHAVRSPTGTAPASARSGARLLAAGRSAISTSSCCAARIAAAAAPDPAWRRSRSPAAARPRWFRGSASSR